MRRKIITNFVINAQYCECVEIWNELEFFDKSVNLESSDASLMLKIEHVTLN